MKLCKDCKRFEDSWAKCWRGGGVTDPVRGTRESQAANCHSQREVGWIAARLFSWCGKEGRYWEAK